LGIYISTIDNFAEHVSSILLIGKPHAAKVSLRASIFQKCKYIVELLYLRVYVKTEEVRNGQDFSWISQPYYANFSLRNIWIEIILLMYTEVATETKLLKPLKIQTW